MIITFLSGYKLYIRYNDYDEYFYQLIFSQKPYDRIRFDNFDDRWDVPTRPHHYHPRGQQLANESPMNGDPHNDMPILITFLPVKKKIETQNNKK